MGEFHFVKMHGTPIQTWELRHKYNHAGVTDVIAHFYNLQIIEATTEFLNQREIKHKEDVKEKRNNI